MALYFIAALGFTDPILEAAITSKLPATDVFKIENGKWAVDTEATTSKEVSEKLGIANTATHIVVTMRSGYFGLAQPSLWEWLAAKQSVKPKV